MRLVDADALKHKIDQEEGRRIEPGWYDGIDTCREIIDNAPTIYAIPVEWLNKQCEMADDRGDMEMTDAISWLIQTWHEEQEAQDGKA